MEEKLFAALPQAVKEIMARFEQAGYQIYAVGGCIRDVLLGREANDWDLCSDATPADVYELFPDYRVLSTGEKHGTVTLMYENVPYEITMFRAESDYDGRWPGAIFAADNVEEDLTRRDFTVNAMAYNPKEGLIDPFDGQKDLETGILRAVGYAEHRFGEDALRILRAMRFAACYGFSIEEETAKAMVKYSFGIRQLSGERIWQELSRMLLGENAGRVLVDFCEVFHSIWPDFYFRVKNERRMNKLPKDVCARLAMLLYEYEERKDVLLSLRCPSEVQDRVWRIWLQTMSEEEGCRWLSRFPKKNRQDDATAALYLMGKEDELLAYRYWLKWLPLDVEDLAINGDDLLALGLQGAKIGEMLHACLEAIWDKKVENNREELLALVSALI